MEDLCNPSPINLNPPNLSTSPFLNDISFDGGGLVFGENIFTKKIEDDTARGTAEIDTGAGEIKARRRINDFDGDILSKYSGDEVKKLTFTGKLREFCISRKKKFESWESLKDWTIEDLEDFKEFFGLLILPGVYRSKTMKDSLKKLVALNKLASELVTKKIPYGEATEHYNTLIENLSLATNIQADLKKRMS